MRQGAILVADIIHIKENCAGDMGFAIFGFRITALIGQMPGGIDNADVRGGEMFGQPFGGDQCRGSISHKLFLLHHI